MSDSEEAKRAAYLADLARNRVPVPERPVAHAEVAAAHARRLRTTGILAVLFSIVVGGWTGYALAEAEAYSPVNAVLLGAFGVAVGLFFGLQLRGVLSALAFLCESTAPPAKSQ